MFNVTDSKPQDSDEIFPCCLPTYLGHTIFITFTWWPGCMVLARLQGIIIHLLSCDDILCHPVTLIKYYHWRSFLFNIPLSRREDSASPGIHDLSNPGPGFAEGLQFH